MNSPNVELKETARGRWSSVAPEAADFDFPGWQTADSVQLTHYWSGVEAPLSRQAEARVLWSSVGLHVLFNCEQHEPLMVTANPQLYKKTIGLWNRDVCEVFVAPDSSQPSRYYEFEGAPTGEWLDIGIKFIGSVRQADWDFVSGFTVTAKVEPGRVWVSMLIPWSEQIPRPEVGDLWRANFLRCVGPSEERGYLAWKPTLTKEPNFHVPEVFGWLEFVM
jgi:hypothetical protein